MDFKINLGETAQNLSSNPVKILALFVVLVYVSFNIIINFSSNLDASNKNLLIWFIIIFTFLVLGAYIYLVVNHHEKFYSPGDFSNEENFIKLTQNLEKQVVKNILTRLNAAEEKVINAKQELDYEKYYIRMIYNQMLNFDESSIRWIDKLLDIKESSELYTRKAYSLANLKKYAEALQATNKAIELNDFEEETNIANTYYNRACYKNLLKYKKTSIEDDLKKAFLLKNRLIEFAKNDEHLKNINIDNIINKM